MYLYLQIHMFINTYICTYMCVCAHTHTANQKGGCKDK